MRGIPDAAASQDPARVPQMIDSEVLLGTWLPTAFDVVRPLDPLLRPGIMAALSKDTMRSPKHRGPGEGCGR